MKEFLKSIDWDRFLKYEIIAIAMVAFLFLVSEKKGSEKIVFSIVLLILWSSLVLLSAYSTFYFKKHVTNQKDLTYKDKNKNNG